MKNIVISESPVNSHKNLRQVVYYNEGPDGKKQSITRHEPLNPAKSVYKRVFGRNGK